MGTFNYWDEKLQGRNYNRRKIGNNTYLTRDGENITMLYHSTKVVVVDPKNNITLNTGGWFTASTKERMNWALARTGYRIIQHNWVWYLVSGDVRYPYHDGITMYADGW